MIEKLEEFKAFVRYIGNIETLDSKELLLENIVDKINEIIEHLND